MGELCENKSEKDSWKYRSDMTRESEKTEGRELGLGLYVRFGKKPRDPS